MDKGVTIKDFELNTIISILLEHFQRFPDDDRVNQENRERVCSSLASYLWNDEHVYGEEFLLIRKSPEEL